MARDVTRATREARRILASHESSTARTITIESAYDKIGGLSLDQTDLLRQGLRAIENGLYRASYVLAWAAFMDFAEVKLSVDDFKAVNTVYPSWGIQDIDDLRDKRTDYQIVEALRETRLMTKNETKAVQGMLSERNEAAHPSHFLPDLNRALGYVADVVGKIDQLQNRLPKARPPDKPHRDRDPT